MRAYRYFRLALSFAVISVLAWLATRQRTYATILVAIPFASALFAKFLMLLRTRILWRELALGAGLTLLLYWIDFYRLDFPATWPVFVSLVGFVSLALLALRMIWWEGEDRRLAIFTFVPSLFFLASGWTGPALLNWTGKAQPYVLDLYLLSFDGSLHVQLPFILGQTFARFPPLGVLGLVVYVGLPIILGLTYAGCLMSDRKNALPAFLAILLVGPVGVIFYNLFPAVGPIHLLPSMFPWRTLPVDELRRLFLRPILADGYRNTMPSMHSAWAYIAFWYSQRLSILEKLLAGFFLLFTLIATLGTGEHYLVDLIVAVPFTVFLLSFTNLLTQRDIKTFLPPLVIGLLITLAWLIALRFFTYIFWISPVIPWTACVASIVASLWTGRRLLDHQLQSTLRPAAVQVIPEVTTR